MKRLERIQAVQSMQNYIREHIGEQCFSPEKMYEAAGYSRRHADRMFKEQLGMTPREYIRAVQLTKGAGDLISTPKSILEIALDQNFQSHEGFSRAFADKFRILPGEYRRKRRIISAFVRKKDVNGKAC